MELTKIIGIGIIGAFLSVTVRTYRPELGIGIAAATGLVIFSMIVPEVSSVISDLLSLCENTGVNVEYFKAIIKIIGIAYITQYAGELTKDAGERAIAKKLEFAGKVSVLVLMMPIVKNLLNTIISTLMSF